MTRLAKLTPLLLLLFTATLSTAQEFGGNPPSIKWKQVNTPAAKVIFPQGLDSAALRVAAIIARMNGEVLQTIGSKQKQISIVLQNQTTIANAYVGLAPFRSEFYLTPEQNSFDVGSLPWADQLAIHEFRHVQQYNNFNVGFSHVLRLFFGEGGQALGNDLSIPNWFFEGDAVFNETYVSEQGRGRLPYFFNGFRALWAAGKDYSYMKIRNGSYLDYTPNWYPLGYMLVAYGREKYGDDFWKKVTQDAASYNGVFYPFQKAVKKYSGVSFKQFRKDGLDYFKEQFKDDTVDRNTESYRNQPKHFVADREYPAFVNDSTIIYVKSTYNHVPVFMMKRGNHERKISVQSVSLDNYFDYHNGKIVYAAYRRDIRWNYRDYSELRILDVGTGREHRITRNTKYFSPAFSGDGKTIVAVNEATNGRCELHLLDAANGKLLSALPNTEGLFYTYPKFYGNDKLISAVRNNKGKMSLAEINISTGNIRYLVPFSYQPITFPAVQNDILYFSQTSGVDDRLFSLNLITGEMAVLDNKYKLSGQIGEYQPAVDDKKVAWVSFSAHGYVIRDVYKEGLNWVRVPSTTLVPGLSGFNITALNRDTSRIPLAPVKTDSLTITTYHKSHHLVNFHSLVPNINDPNYTLNIEGENVLNTLQSELSFTYNRNEGYKRLGFDAVYGALFPYISGGANYTIDRRGISAGFVNNQLVFNNIYWNETNLHAGFEVPLNFSSSKHFTSLQLGSNLYYAQISIHPAYQSLVSDKSYTYSENYIHFNNNIQQARQNIYPRLGQSISLDFKSAISSITSSQFLASGSFYFPGVLANHNLVINLAHQQKYTNSVINFSNDFPFSRGYQAENLDNMDKAGANYHFPIAYPDAGVANAVYLLRLRGNVFYDYTRIKDFIGSNVTKGIFRSTGAEIYFDTQVFNQGSISFGFRYSRLLDPDLFGGAGRNRFEIIVPVSIF